METCCVDDDRVWSVWNWCSDAYLRNGQKLSFPARTNPKNTYQWRYAKAIAERFVEWQFDDDTCRKFIDLATKYAKQTGVLRKGLAVLHQTNMLDICYRMLLEEKNSNRQSQDSLENIHAWVTRQIGVANPVDVLLQRARPDAMCNLVQWYRANKISDLYLAVSKNCGKALSRLTKLDISERELLPKPTKLYMLRADIARNVEKLKQIKHILDSDWREL